MRRKPLPSHLHICLIAKKFPLVAQAAHHSYLFHIARGLVEKGHRVHVISAHHPQKIRYLEKDGVRIDFLNAQAQIDESRYPFQVKEKFQQLHYKDAFHLIHCVDNTGSKIIQSKSEFRLASVLDVEATRLAQIFSIMGSKQDTPLSALRTAIAVSYKFLKSYFGGDKALLNKADGVIVSSPQQRLALERYYLYPDSRIFTIAYGIVLANRDPSEKAKEYLEKLKLPDRGFKIVSISDMTEMTEIIHLFDSFEKVVIKKPNTRLIIIGNGPFREQVEYEMLNRVLGSKVILLGSIKNIEIPEYIGLAEIFINISSRTTGFEASVLEAMSQKKIIIASEMSALSTLIEDHVDGFLVRPADIQSISNLILQIINRQISTQNMGEAARQKVLKFADPNKMINDSIDAYYSVLKRTKYYN